MQRQIEDLKRNAEQGSQQLQGEALEFELEAILRAKFPMDNIKRIGKGEFGGDVIQRVVGPMGQGCGAILCGSPREPKPGVTAGSPSYVRINVRPTPASPS